MSDRAPVEVADRDGIRTILLNRPDVANALDAPTVTVVDAAVRAAPDHGISMIVLRGAGRHLSGGFDLDAADDDHALARRFIAVQRLLQALRTVPCVTIAYVHGAAYGAAGDLVAACDYRLGTLDASFRFPGIHFGVVLGTRHLSRVVGPSLALDTLLNNRVIDAHTATSAGLLTHRVESWEEASQLIDELREAVAGFPRDRLAVLLENTRWEPDAREMRVLVESVSEAGLAERLRAFRSPGTSGRPPADGDSAG